MIAVIRGTGERLVPDAGRGWRLGRTRRERNDVDDLEAAPPRAAATPDPEVRAVTGDATSWALVHRAVAGAATARGVRALLRSSDGDFRITADHLDGDLILTIEARRELSSTDGDDDASAENPSRAQK